MADTRDLVDPDELTYRTIKHIILDEKTTLGRGGVSTGEIVQEAIREDDIHPRETLTALAEMEEGGHVRKVSRHRWMVTGSLGDESIY